MSPPTAEEKCLLHVLWLEADLILSCFDTKELFSVLKLNKHCKDVILAYFRRAFRIENLLRPYFLDYPRPDPVSEFRSMQSSTGALISGSTALQFFARTRYDDSDLDLYVNQDRVEKVLDFLKDAGYTYVPRTGQAASLEAQLKAPPRKLEPEEEYNRAGFRDLFEFTKEKKIIQVITAEDTPMKLILQFHSTVVMNVISHANAFCLYPRSTFIEGRPIACFRMSSAETYQAAMVKYSSRGCKMTRYPNLPQREREHFSFNALKPHYNAFELSSATRCVGDNRTWTIPLGPLQAGSGSSMNTETLHLHTWAAVIHQFSRRIDDSDDDDESVGSDYSDEETDGEVDPDESSNYLKRAIKMKFDVVGVSRMGSKFCLAWRPLIYEILKANKEAQSLSRSGSSSPTEVMAEHVHDLFWDQNSILYQ